MIASGSGDGRIRLWDSVTGACKASLGDMGGPQDGVTSVVLRQARDQGRGGRLGGFAVLFLWYTSEFDVASSHPCGGDR